MASASRIRLALPEEAAALARFMAETFVAAYGPFNRPEDVELHVRRNFGDEHVGEQLRDPSVVTLVAEVDGILAGYAQLRLGAAVPGQSAAPSPGEVLRFYLGAAWVGSGLAAVLMDAVKLEARARGIRTLWLSTWQGAARPQAFYRKAGFTVAGETAFVLGSDRQSDWVMVHTLDGPSSSTGTGSA